MCVYGVVVQVAGRSLSLNHLMLDQLLRKSNPNLQGWGVGGGWVLVRSYR